MIKDQYPDKNGYDSLKHLKIAVKNKCEIFLTNNQLMIKDRRQLEKYYDIKIMTLEEFKIYDSMLKFAKNKKGDIKF